MNLTRAGFSEDAAITTGSLDVDSGLSYSLDASDGLRVDGGNVSGKLIMKSFSRDNAPHGEEINGTLDVDC